MSEAAEVPGEESDLPARRPSRVMTCLAIACLLVAGFFYLVAVSSIETHGGSDPAGNAMNEGFAFLSELLLWMALGAFLVIALVQAKPTGEIIAGAVVVGGGGAVASMVALMLIDEIGWARITPYLMPPLVALLGAWTGFSTEFSLRTRRIAAAAFVLLAFPLIAIPFFEQAQWQTEAPVREAENQRLQAEFEAREAHYRALAEAEFQALGPDNRVDDFIEHLGDSSHVEQALPRLRTSRSRQADTVRLMRTGTHIRYFDRLSEFGVEPTAEVCAAYRAMFETKLAEAVPSNGNWRGVPQEMDGQFDTLRWLMANDCDLRAPVARLLRLVRSLGDQYFETYPAELEAILRGEPRPAG